MWTIILGIAVFLVLILLIALFGSFTFKMKVSYRERTVAGTIVLRWINPFLLSVEYDLSKGLIDGRVFGKRLRPADLFESKEAAQNRESGFPEQREPPADSPEEGIDEAEKEISDTQERVDLTDLKEPVCENELSHRKQGKRKIPQLLNGKRIYFMVRDRRWRGKIVNWLKRFFSSLTRLIRFNCLKADIKAGLSDPVHTGKIYGYFTAIKSAMVMQKRDWELSLQPVFMKNYLEFDCAISFKTTMWRFCVPVLYAVLFFPYIHTRRLWKTAKNRAEGKDEK